MSPLRSRGVALPLAVFALVILGALVACAFFLGLQEARLGRNALALQEARAAAEAGADLAVERWVPSVANALPVGDSVLLGGALAVDAGPYRGSVRRLNRDLFLVRSEGFSRRGTARQEVGLLVRLDPVPFPAAAALSADDTVRLSGSPLIDGTDRSPPGWTDCSSSLAAPIAGIRVPAAGDVDRTGCDGSCVIGAPALAVDSTVGGSIDEAWVAVAGLRSQAKSLPAGSIVPTPTVLPGPPNACETSAPTNWGDPDDPSAACGRYFPVLWAEGDLTLIGGRGQGVLVVGGDLTLENGARFYGAVLVRGRVVVADAASAVFGSVKAGRAELDGAALVAMPSVAYSSCALGHALNGTASAAPLSERRWVDLY